MTGDLAAECSGVASVECESAPLPGPFEGGPRPPACGRRTTPRTGAESRNRQTLRGLRRDENEDALWAAVWKDVELGRMEAPVDVASLPLDRVVLSKRFSVVQGPKIRPVDDATASDLNPRTRLGRRIDHDTVDHLEELAR